MRTKCSDATPTNPWFWKFQLFFNPEIVLLWSIQLQNALTNRQCAIVPEILLHIFSEKFSYPQRAQTVLQVAPEIFWTNLLRIEPFHGSYHLSSISTGSFYVSSQSEHDLPPILGIPVLPLLDTAALLQGGGVCALYLSNSYRTSLAYSFNSLKILKLISDFSVYK